MNGERWEQIKIIFDNALKQPPAEREDFIAEQCTGDDELRHEVESLLFSLDSADSFLQKPAVGVVNNIITGKKSVVAEGEHLSHYRIIKQIGSGGMGEVYLAEDRRLNRKAALKILPPEFAQDKERMSRFVREAKSASAFNHQNIVTIYDIGEEGGTHFIAAEFIDGTTLREYAKTNRPSFKGILEIATQIATALNEAHSAGIIHRDIKPDNVMIRRDGLVKVLDFGIAKLSGANSQLNFDEVSRNAVEETSPGLILGTANYMSPEQAKGKDIDARSDIFSFGVVLYEMIEKRLPFDGETVMEKMVAIINQEPQPTSAEVPPQIETIIKKCLRKDKAERYQTSRDLLLDLKAAKLRFETQRKPENEESQAQILQPVNERSNQTITSRTQHDSVTFKKSSVKKALFAAALIVLLIAIGSGYWFYTGNNSKQIESIAVMPFENASNNTEVEYLSDGITETLISNLSQLPKLNVKARSSVFHYKGKNTNAQTIGRELNVQAVLNGRVVQRGDDLLLYLELIDTETNNQIWGGQYQRKITNLVSLQTEIARDVSYKLSTKLSGEDEARLAKNYTDNFEAYQLYLKGTFHANKRTAKDSQKAIKYFSQATTVDPNYALAYAGLADAYALLSAYGGAPAHEAIPKGRDAAQKALSLDEKLAEAHAALGIILFEYDLDFTGAERELRRAIELNPNYVTAHNYYGQLLSSLGRHDEASTEYLQALELDPLSLIVNRLYGQNLIFARRYDEGLAQLKKTTELDAGFATANNTLAIVYQLKGNYAESVEAHARYQELIGDTAKAALIRESFAKGGWNGFLHTVTKSPQPFLSPINNVAVFHATLGEKDKAFAELEKSWEKRENYTTLIKVDPRLDALRDVPRFQELLNKIGFPN